MSLLFGCRYMLPFHETTQQPSQPVAEPTLAERPIAEQTMAQQVIAEQKVPLHNVEKVLPRRKGRRDRSYQAPVWLPLAAQEVRPLIERFAQLEDDSLHDACGVCADVTMGEYRLRLHALAWSEFTLIDRALSLLLLLSPRANRDNQFSVQVSLPNVLPLIMPPLTFAPNPMAN